ncbi:MAG: hypothetical protein H6672_13700 [Anaerolineaceae bacterium]|nr:hypothetical protein [Anaerolineaceae bacterium]
MSELGKDNVKLLMQWDIKQESEQEFFEFQVREWIPGITQMGLEPTGAWYTTYSRGETPQIMTEGLAEDLETMRNILGSEEWKALHDKLLKFVNNYQQKVVRVTGGFQM